MRTWLISYGSKACRPTLISAHEQQDTPTLRLSYNDKPFSVEFQNRSDYFASRHGTEADVIIVSAGRKKLIRGTAVNELTTNNK
jgi:hypothetical protein